MLKIQELFTSFPNLISDRYNLRKIDKLDYNEIYQIYSDEESLRYQNMQVIASEEDAKKYIGKILNGYENNLFIRWAISTISENDVIGLIALHHIDYDEKNAKIGYILNRKYWNQNIMSDSLFLVIDYLFSHTEIERLEAQIHPCNIASIKLVEKLGFKRESIKFDEIYNSHTSKYEDRIVMSLSKS